MNTLNTAVVKHPVNAKRSNALTRVLLTRKVNRFLSQIGQALNVSSMVNSK